jgi:hypothetical protein
MYSFNFSLTPALDGVGGQHHGPAALPRAERDPSPRRLGGPQGRPVWLRKMSPSRGFYPRAVQSAASRYTD